MRLNHAASLTALAALFSLGATRAFAQADASKRPVAHEEADNEHAIPAAQVPQAVRNAVQHAYPGATVSKWTTEVERGRTSYEAETVTGTSHVDIALDAAGTIMETETRIAPSALPAAVRAAATAGNAQIDRAEMSVSQAGRDTTYEMTIHGRRGELRLRPNGQPAARE
jgi:uncharacterized membrane protein YkoI